jgi:hypothetical protein
MVLCGALAVWTEHNAVWHGQSERSLSQSVRWATESGMDTHDLIRPSRCNHIQRHVRCDRWLARRAER